MSHDINNKRGKRYHRFKTKVNDRGLQQANPQQKDGAKVAKELSASDNDPTKDDQKKLHWAIKYTVRGEQKLRKEYNMSPIGNSIPGVHYFSYQDALTDPTLDGSKRTQYLIAWQLIMGVIPFVTGAKIEEFASIGTPYTKDDVAARLLDDNIKSSWEKCHANFSRVMRKEKGPRSELFYGRDPFAVGEDLKEKLRELDWPLLDIERGQKFGPCDRGGWPKLQEAVRRQFSFNEVNPNTHILHAAAQRVIRELIEANGGKKFTPLSVEESYVRLGSNTDFSTGAGYYTFRNASKIKEAEWHTHITWARAVRGGRVHPYIPGEVGTRSQAGRMDTDGSYESKTRLVIADSKTVQIAGGCLMYPQLDVMQQMPQYMALAGNHVIFEDNLVMDPLKECAIGSSVDFEKYDSTLRYLLELWWREYEAYLWETDEIEFCDWYGINHVYAPILAEFGAYFTENGHGLFSGKIDTNITGSKLNRWAAIYVMLASVVGEDWEGELSDELVDLIIDVLLFHMAMGDDTLFFVHSIEKLLQEIDRREMDVEPEILERLRNLTWRDFRLPRLKELYATLGLEASLDPDKVYEFTPESNRRIACFLSRYYLFDMDNGLELNNVASFVRVMTSLLCPENLILEEQVVQATREPVLLPGEELNEDGKARRVPLRLDWLTDKEVVGSCLLKYWSSLSNLWNNGDRYVEPILKWIMVNAPHKFNPTMMLSVDHVMYYLEKYGSHVNYDQIRESGIESTHLFELMVEIYAELCEIPKDCSSPAFAYTFTELAKLADESQFDRMEFAKKKRREAAVKTEELDMVQMIERYADSHGANFAQSLMIAYEKEMSKRR
jgi:hypothetical protein